MSAKTAIALAISILLVMAGCSRKSQQTASNGAPGVAQVASSTATSSTLNIPQTAPAPAPVPEPEPENKEIVTQGDGTEFLAKAVLNECGTNAEPTECLIKTVQIESDPYLPSGVAYCDQVGTISQSAYLNCMSDTMNMVDVIQITLQLNDGSYLALGCAIAYLQPVSELHDMDVDAGDDGGPIGYDDANPSKNSCDDNNARKTLEDTFKIGEEHRFGRRDNTVVLHEHSRGDDGDSDFRTYFLVFGACASIHECQELPRMFHFKDNHWQTMVAPWAWESYHGVEAKDEALKAEYRAKQNELNSPR